LDININVVNIGFASIINERPLYIVLAGADETSTYKVKLEVDPRTWEPGSTALTVKLHVPSNAEEGEYRLGLWLPDGYESLRDNPLYAIQFANENVWDEATGFNILGNVSVTKSAGGVSERGDEFSTISAESQTERDILSFSPVLVSDETSAPTEIPTLEPTSGTGANDLISNLQILNETTFLTIKFDFVGKVEDYNAFQVFLDVDQNADIGYSVSGIGADYLLENGNLNKYEGAGSDWNWSVADTQVLFDNENNAAQWLFDTSGFGEILAIDFVCQIADLNWNAIASSDKQTYSLK
jgi:hypothetical protein